MGIYVFYVPIKLQKWREANTFFEDELTEYDSEQKLKFEKVSSFDGGFWQYFGWVLLGFIITVCTLGIGFPVAVKMIYSWQQRHKIYCKKRCIFDGTAAGLFGTWILYIFLTIITCGIFSLCIPVKIKSWIVKHTHLTESLEITEEENNFKPKLLPGIICLGLLIFTFVSGIRTRIVIFSLLKIIYMVKIRVFAESQNSAKTIDEQIQLYETEKLKYCKRNA